MKEAISIQTAPESSHLNHNSGHDLPDYWIATYKIRDGVCVGFNHLSASYIGQPIHMPDMIN